ncbi:TPA: hypothetical protein AABR62_001787 [Neisseria gonorrhoeae]
MTDAENGRGQDTLAHIARLLDFLSFLAVAAACRMAGCLPCMYVNTF